MTGRIDEYGAHLGDAPRDDARQERERRRRRFAAAHRIGDVVWGRPARPGPDGLTWIDVNGHLLLADIGRLEDSLLCFTVEANDPEIVLKILPDEPGQAFDSPGSLGRAVARYEAARAALDEHLLLGLWPAIHAGNGPDDRPGRKTAFFRHLAESPEAAELAHALTAALTAFTPALRRFAALNRARAARLAYLPWLEAQALESDCLILLYDDSIKTDDPEVHPHGPDPDRLAARGARVRLLYGCLLPRTGRVLCEAAPDQDGFSAGLYAEYPEALRERLRERGAAMLLAPPGTRLAHLGPMPAGAAGPLALLTERIAVSRLRLTI